MNQCPFDPSIYNDVPLGMFHCPLCGEMVIAGMPHPDYSNHLEELSKMVTCGNCGEITTVDLPYACLECGRMLCGKCGFWCEDHCNLDEMRSNGDHERKGGFGDA